MFLAAFMRSKLARYFVFHTSANLGTERDQVHIAEVMRLPFYLSGNQIAPGDSAAIITKIAAKIVKEFFRHRLDALIEVRKCLEQIGISLHVELKYIDHT